jgi:hypothetical protein
MFAVVVVYAGLLTSFLGFVSFLKPFRFIGIATRSHGLAVLGAGFIVIVIGMSLPAREERVESTQMKLDEFVPAWQFNEVHSIRVKASPDKVYRAIKEVRAGEIRLFQTLTWIRRFGRPGPESILNAPENVPLLEVATRTSFLALAEEPEREIVLGTLVVVPPGWRPKGKPSPDGFKALREPGFALAATNFRLEDTGAGETVVTTETRVYATDEATRRRFAPYWRVIYPGSALIRRMWLKAAKKRTETDSAGGRGKNSPCSQADSRRCHRQTVRSYRCCLSSCAIKVEGSATCPKEELRHETPSLAVHDSVRVGCICSDGSEIHRPSKEQSSIQSRS